MMIDDIRVIFVDVDGTLTDGMFEVDRDGKLSKSFNTRDTLAMHRLQKAGYDVQILTGDDASCVHKYYEDRNGITVNLDIADKRKFVQEFLDASGWDWKNIAMIGDAENDLQIMEKCGWTACPADAREEIQELCNFIAYNSGGDAAVYEIARKFAELAGIDWIEPYV